MFNFIQNRKLASKTEKDISTIAVFGQAI